jgi:hypothetical protein
MDAKLATRFQPIAVAAEGYTPDGVDEWCHTTVVERRTGDRPDVGPGLGSSPLPHPPVRVPRPLLLPRPCLLL